MSKYFLDTEFIEGTQTKRILGIPYGKTKPTIDLISIGIVAEDGNEYYAISRDFNLDEAWNRYDEKVLKVGEYPTKVYWIRENVLRPIFDDLIKLEEENYLAYINSPKVPILYNESYVLDKSFTKHNFGYLIWKYGKSNKEIADDIICFCNPDFYNTDKTITGKLHSNDKPEFYGYYSDYDWTVFCWLFGRMIDLPNGFPMYCIDLKQDIDNYIAKTWKDVEMSTFGHEGITLTKLKSHPDYPIQINEHNALSDARFNRDLYNFLKQL